MKVFDRIFSPLGIELNETNCVAYARLANGSRVTAVVRPLAISDPTMTIIKFERVHFAAENISKFGTIIPVAMAFLRAC